MKRVERAVFYAAVAFGLCACLGQWLSTEVAAIAQEKVKSRYHRELRITGRSWGLQGLRWKGLELSAIPDFSAGRWAQADEMTFKIDWLATLATTIKSRTLSVAGTVTLDMFRCPWFETVKITVKGAASHLSRTGKNTRGGFVLTQGAGQLLNVPHWTDTLSPTPGVLAAGMFALGVPEVSHWTFDQSYADGTFDHGLITLNRFETSGSFATISASGRIGVAEGLVDVATQLHCPARSGQGLLEVRAQLKGEHWKPVVYLEQLRKENFKASLKGMVPNKTSNRL